MEKIKISRQDLILGLLERDGDFCMYPGCSKELDFDAVGPREVTIDHHYPQSWCIAQGWSTEEIWALDNLRLMCKACNAKKSDLVPNEDGTLPVKPQSATALRRNRGPRPEVCQTCESGRALGPDDECHVCGSGPMPYSFPRWAKLLPNECSHSGIWWCWCCASGIVEREPAFVDAFGAEDELSA